MSKDARRLCSEGELTAADLLRDATARLAAAGIANPRREARLLLNLALGRAPNELIADGREITPDTAERFDAFLARRLRHEPYSRIAGKREFWSLELGLSPETLDPRPDSETLIEAALALRPDRAAPLRIVDFGTGTGALLLALLAEYPNASGIGIDILPGAVAQAAANAAALGLAGRARFACGNWGDGLAERADVIVANPPYIKVTELATLPVEVRGFDPETALNGGPDGLEAYRQLVGPVSHLLKPDGVALFEIGAGQGPAVETLFAEVGFEIVNRCADLSGVVRCLAFDRRRNFGKSFK